MLLDWEILIHDLSELNLAHCPNFVLKTWGIQTLSPEQVYTFYMIVQPIGQKRGPLVKVYTIENCCVSTLHQEVVCNDGM